MLNLGTGELLVVFLVALIVLGPSKMPDAARQVGRMVAELRRLSSGFQDEMRAAMQDPTPTLPPLSEQPPPAAEVEPLTPASEPTDTAPAAPTRRRRVPLRAEGSSASAPPSDE